MSTPENNAPFQVVEAAELKSNWGKYVSGLAKELPDLRKIDKKSHPLIRGLAYSLTQDAHAAKLIADLEAFSKDDTRHGLVIHNCPIAGDSEESKKCFKLFSMALLPFLGNNMMAPGWHHVRSQQGHDGSNTTAFHHDGKFSKNIEFVVLMGLRIPNATTTEIAFSGGQHVPLRTGDMVIFKDKPQEHRTEHPLFPSVGEREIMGMWVKPELDVNINPYHEPASDIRVAMSLATQNPNFGMHL